MRSKTEPIPIEKWDNTKFAVRFHVREIDDIHGGKMFEYDEVIISNVTRKGIIDALVARRYDFNDEISLAFSRDGDEEERIEHEAYVLECKAIADEILGNE